MYITLSTSDRRSWKITGKIKSAATRKLYIYTPGNTIKWLEKQQQHIIIQIHVFFNKFNHEYSRLAFSHELFLYKYNTQ